MGRAILIKFESLALSHYIEIERWDRLALASSHQCTFCWRQSIMGLYNIAHVVS
jgi:hypothetical protein